MMKTLVQIGQQEMMIEVHGHVDMGMALTVDDAGRVVRYTPGTDDQLIGVSLEPNHPFGLLAIWDEQEL